MTLILCLTVIPWLELSDDRMPLLWGETEIAYCRSGIAPLEVAVGEECIVRAREERRS